MSIEKKTTTTKALGLPHEASSPASPPLAAVALAFVLCNDATNTVVAEIVAQGTVYSGHLGKETGDVGKLCEEWKLRRVSGYNGDKNFPTYSVFSENDMRPSEAKQDIF